MYRLPPKQDALGAGLCGAARWGRRGWHLDSNHLDSTDTPASDLRTIHLQYGGVITGPLENKVVDLDGHGDLGEVAGPHVRRSAGLKLSLKSVRRGLPICVLDEDGKRVTLMVRSPRNMKDYAYREAENLWERRKAQAGPEAPIHVQLATLDDGVVSSEEGLGIEIRRDRLLCHTMILPLVIHMGHVFK